jgi:hypothetical protein
MSKATTHESKLRDAIRRLRALTVEVDRAVTAAAQVRREVQRTLAVAHSAALAAVKGG